MGTGSESTPSAPYVIVRMASQEHRTPTLCYNFEQNWHSDNVFLFNVEGEDKCVEFQVMDALLTGDEIIGQAVVQLQNFRRLPPAKWHQRKERFHGKDSGILEFAVHLEPCPKATSSPERRSPSAEAQPTPPLSPRSNVIALIRTHANATPRE